MKNIQRKMIISLFPLLTPLVAFAESDKQAKVTSSVAATNVSSHSWRASEVTGLEVKNANNDKVGEVEDLVLDMKDGKVLAVIISSGGFLGLGDSLSAVPVSALRYDKETKVLKTELTKEQLGKAPQFKSDAWPDFNEATFKDSLRSFRDAIGGDVTAPDNTAQNEKEMEKETVTPTDQGNSDQDIQMTKNIRVAIMDADLSFNAKNIKIITRNEYVVLKGVVESVKEHQAVLKIARDHAKSAKITDELKVKSE